MNGAPSGAARVAIVAVEIRTALGPDLDTTWDAMVAGRSAVGPIDWFDASGFGSAHAARISTGRDDAEDDPTLRILGPHGRLLEDVLSSAHEAAGARSIPREGVGLYIATGMVDSPVEELAPAVLAARDDRGKLDLESFFRTGYRLVHPLWPLSALNNVVAGQVAADLDARGDNLVLSSQADAGLRVLVEALHSVRDRTTRCALVGGVSEPVTPASLVRLRLRGVPEGVAPGEGGGAVVLEPHDASRRPDRKPLGLLCGGATAFGGQDKASAALARAMRAAIADAGLEAHDVDSVFLHGEGTSLDAAELAALEDVFGRRRAELGLTATKGALGHLGAGGPVVDVALAARALDVGRLPPTVTDDTLESAAAGILRAGSHAPQRVMVVAAGNAGGVGALVLEGAR